MDWADSPELMAIYLGEIDERSARLVSGGFALAEGRLAIDDLTELIRDAHTLKGSSRMMGHAPLGSAAEVLEHAWRKVERVGVAAGRIVGKAMAEIADAFHGAARSHGDVSTVETQLSEVREWLGDLPVAKKPVEEDGEDNPRRPERRNRNQTSQDLDASLGGLLAGVQEDLKGEVMRVDTSGLYRLINRVVEVELEARALVDLSRVSFEGADMTRILAAWRPQLERIHAEVGQLRESAVALANVRFGEAVETFPQFVRFLSRRLGKETELVVAGFDLLVDRQMVDQLREPLRHLIVNAVHHGIESPENRLELGKSRKGRVEVAAEIREGRLVVEVFDDGAGVDWEKVEAKAREAGIGTSPSELVAALLRPGFSTVEEPNDFSGSGEGLALVGDVIDRVGGTVFVDSVPGTGTTVTIDIPASLVLQKVVIIVGGEQYFGLLESAVLDQFPLVQGEVSETPNGWEVQYGDEKIPVISFAEAMGMDGGMEEPEILVISTRSGLVGVAVTEVIDSRQVAVKSLGPILDDVAHLVGGAFLGGGEVLVVVDHHHLGARAKLAEKFMGDRPSVLVVDDSSGVRMLIAATLRGRGYEVEVAHDAQHAIKTISSRRFDLLIVDYAMPKSNGVELISTLRRSGLNTPIVMVSGVADEETKAAAWEAGVDAYLDKSDLRRGELVRAVSRLIESASRVS